MRKEVLYLVLFLLIIPICFSDHSNASYIEVNGTEQLRTFETSEDNHFFKFNAIKNNKYVIETTNKTDIDITDTIITLYDTDGTTKIENNDDIILGAIRTSRIIWTATSNGTYYVKVTEYSGETGGTYGISVLRVGKLKPFLVTDTNKNISWGNTFNVTTGVKCEDGYCLNVIAALDPEKPEKLNKVKVEDKVYSKLEKEEKIPVIVKYKEGYKPNNKKIKREYNLINAIALELTKEELNSLKKNKNIEFIQYDEKVSINLDSSVPSINADKVWPLKLNNINITGQDFSVCVLDTGVNYTHPDFNSNCDIPEGERNLKTMNCTRIPDGYDFINNDADPMDDHGHGSHVSGIILSEDNTYKGVAPKANLIPVKVLNHNGEGSTSDVIAGIEWCISNSEEYNIIVISMSLGGGLFADYCNHFSIADIINEAVNKNISVVVAAGNDGSTKGISAPACVENATSVGATDNSNNIYFNRHFILDILAPGIGVTSTAYNSIGHTTKFGTSMSTPHIAGTIILIQQYWNLLYNRQLNVKEIEHKLKYHSTRIYDSESKYYFPRVDVEKSVTGKGVIPTDPNAKPFYSLTPNPHNAFCLDRINLGETCNQTWTINTTGDLGTTWEFFTIYKTKYDYNITPKFNITIYPEYIKLLSPTNGTITQERNISFNCEINNSKNFTNLTLYLGHNGIWKANQTKNITEDKNIVEFNITNLNYNNYTWNCLTNTNLSAEKNYSLQIKKTDVNFTDINYSSLVILGKKQNITFNVSNATEIWIEAYGNHTLNITNPISYSYTPYVSGNNTFTIYGKDKTNLEKSISKTFYVNDTNEAPEIFDISYSSSIDINDLQKIIVIALDSDNLTLYYNYNNQNITLEQISSYNYTYNFNPNDCGTYNFKVYAINTKNYTDIVEGNFEVTGCTTSQSSGGGGSSGGSTKTTSEDTTTESIEILKIEKNKPIEIKLKSKKIGIESIKITTKSDIENVNLEIKKIDQPKHKSPSNFNYKYLEIALTDSNEEIIDVNFKFNVEKDFILKNKLSINDIVMFRYNEKLEELSTRYLYEQIEYYVYESNSSGFSLFAIGEKEKKLHIFEPEIKEPEKEQIIEINETKEIIIQEKEEKLNDKSKFKNPIIITIIVIILILLTLLILKIKNQKLIKTKKDIKNNAKTKNLKQKTNKKTS